MFRLPAKLIFLMRGLMSGMALLSCSLLAAGQEDESAATVPVNSLSVGGHYSRGDFGEDARTSVYYLPVSLEHSVPGWRFRVTAPYLRISGPGNVLVNTGGVRRPDDLSEYSEDRKVSPAGVGDVLISATRELPAFNEWMPFIDLGVEVKMPTAEPGLGTGAADMAVQADLYQVVGDNTLFGALGYRLRGKSQWFEGLRNSLYLSAGVMRPWGHPGAWGTWDWGLMYDYREAASTLSVETHEVLTFVSWTPLPAWSFMGYAGRGFTRDSPDYAAGVQLNYRW